MRPMPFSERSHIPVIEYRERFVQINLLHMAENNYRCRNEGCPCQQEKPKSWKGLKPPRVTHVDHSTGDELHDRIRALRLPDYPQARIHTYILGAFSTETRIVVHMADRPIFTMVMSDREELRAMLEDGSLLEMLTQKTAYFLKRQEAERRAMEGDTGEMARMEWEQRGWPWR